MTLHLARAITCGAALALAACAAAPLHYYTLVTPDPTGIAASAPAQAVAFELLPVGVPPQVDQPQLVVRDGGQEMRVLQGERWIAPLADELHAALAADLVRALPGRDVTGLPGRGGSRLRIKVDVRRFESQPGAYALLGAGWELRLAPTASAQAAPTPALACTSTVREPVGGGYAALVAGHQRALGALAAQIAGAARTLESGQSASCPRG